MARHPLLIVLLATSAALALAAPAAATDVPIVVAVRAGQLALGSVSRSSGRIRVTVIDARGSGRGWTLTAVPRGQARADTSISAVDAICAHESTCTLPRTALRYPLRLTASGPTVICTARKGTGMGIVELALYFVGGLDPAAGLSFHVASA
jgi:hypothetical protein